MKKILSFIALALICVCVNAQNAMLIKKANGVTDAAYVTDIVSVEFSADYSKMIINSTYEFNIDDVQEITYGALPEDISVTYQGDTAVVINPYFLTGVTASINGADVTITNTNATTEYTTTLSGTTTNGSFTYNGAYKTTVVLNGVNITSSKGAAIDIECSKRVALEIKKGTENTLVDCENGSQKAALYCKGHLEIDKAGTLTVTGKTAHAISAKEYVQLKKADGIINILGAVKDGIHCKQYFLGNGYTVNISGVADDGIQTELDGEANEDGYVDGSVNLAGGTYTINVTADDASAINADSVMIINNDKSTPVINITTTGAADKGLKANGNVNIADGEMTFTMSGNKIVEDSDISYTTAIKSDCDINVTGGSITVKNTADGGKGISADGNINISGSSTVVDITANGAGGTAEATSSGSTSETTKSYKVYVAMPTSGSAGGWGGGPGGGGQSGAWTTLYLYKSDGTLVQQLTSSVSKTANNQTKTFYYYDFKASDSNTYYFKSADYQSRGGFGGNSTYTIKSSTFSGPTSGEDYYYEISSSYSTSGTTRTYSLSNVTNTWNGSTSDASEESGESYNASGIKADGNVTISAGTITVKNSGEMSKSIKSKATVTVDGGTLTLTPSGAMKVINSDASYSSGIKAVNFIQNGGSITITATGAAGRGVSATNITTNGGSLTITNSGAGQSGTNDSYTAKGLKADSKIALNAGTIKVSMTGNGGKGIKSSGTYTQGVSGGTGPDLNVTTTGSSFGSSSSTGGWGGMGGMSSSSGSSAKAIKIQGAAVVYGGTTHISTATDGAEGLESKTSVEIAGGNHYIKCYDDCINSSGIIKFSGGNTVCYGFGNDAVDSNYGRSGAITIAGGNVFAYTTKGSPEEGLDCDNNSYITITSGIAVSAGAAQGGGGGSSTGSVGSSSQGYYLGSSPSSYGSTYYYTLCNTSGTAMCTYKFEANCSNSLSLLTAPNLGKGSVTVKYGTAKPTACDSSVSNAAGTDVFFINPTVTTSGTTATVTAK